MTQMVYVPIRRLTNSDGKHVCRIPGESCFFLVIHKSDIGTDCNYCERGIIDDTPHRLCPIQVGCGFTEKTV